MNFPEIPLTEPVWILAAALAAFAVVPAVFERLRLPGIVGLILLGAVLGEHGAGVLTRPGAIEMLGTGGLLFLMFLVGLELDLGGFVRHKRASITFGILSYAVPQVVGTITCLALGTDVDYAVLAGAIFGSHTVVTYPIASQLGLLRHRAVTCALGATVITNILTLTVLALMTALADGGGAAALARFGVMLIAYALLAILVLPRLAHLILARAGATGGAASILAILFAFAVLGQLAGIQPIIGVMLAGLACNAAIREREDVLTSLRTVGDLILVPFFLLSLGMLIDLRVLADVTPAAVALTVAALVVASKYAAAFITERIFGFSAVEGGVMFGLTVPHAAATSAIALIGRQVGIFDDLAVTVAVIVILITNVCGAFAADRAGHVLRHGP